MLLSPALTCDMPGRRGKKGEKGGELKRRGGRRK
jgi:hypothetical protein